MPKTLIFPAYPVKATRYFPHGEVIGVTFGCYERLEITHENGHDADRYIQCMNAVCDVLHVHTEDGSKIVFHKPFYKMEMNPPKEDNAELQGGY